MPQQKQLLLGLALAGSLVAITGCTGGADEATVSPTSTPSASASVAEDAATEPIAVQTITPAFSRAGDTTELGILSLAVEDEIMILRYVATPDFASESDSATIGLSRLFGSAAIIVASQIKLVDRANLKEYSALHNGNDWWGTTGTETVNGTPTYGYAVFAAPEDDIDSIDVSFNAQFPEFVDVPIEQEAG